jgi:hypothetical protein
MPLLSLAIAVAFGYFRVRLWLPDSGARSRWAPLLHAGLGAGLGIGVFSCLYFLLLLAGVAKLPVVFAAEALLLAASAGIYFKRRAAVPVGGENGDAAESFPWNWALGIAAAAMAAIFLATFFNASELNPQGGWDAFAIWNLRARFLLNGETWRYAVASQSTGTHMEYPLLLSSAIARGWLYGGGPSQAVPVAIALLFPLAIAMVLVSGISILRGAAAGLLAVSILLAHQFLATAAPDQYADLPLAYFGLASVAVLALDRSARYLTLAGLFAGFAAWTKNEGLLLLAVLTIALAITTWRSAGWSPAVRTSALFLAGALPLLCLVLWFKLFVAPADPTLAGVGGSLAHNPAEAGRWGQVALGFVTRIPVIAVLLLAFAIGLLRIRPSVERPPAIFLPLIALGLMLVGDFAVVVLSGSDVEWLLATALDRLYLQLWPLLVFGVFLHLRRPEDLAVAGIPVKRVSKSRRR